MMEVHAMPKFFNEREVSELIRCSLSKLRADRWQRRGLPYLKNGRSVLYDEADVLGFLNSHRIETSPIEKRHGAAV
jgi:hypothetical protein